MTLVRVVDDCFAFGSEFGRGLVLVLMVIGGNGGNRRV